MAIQGLRDTSNFVTDQRPKNWREGILLLYPNGTFPLFALTSLMKSRTVDDPEFNWWEKSYDKQVLTLGANAGTGTTLTINSGGLTLKDGHLLWAQESGELMRVNGDPSSDTVITVERGFGATAATNITATGAGVNPNLYVVGNANEEGSDAPTSIAYDPTKKYNYTQIFRNTLEATRTASRTRLRTGDAVKEAKRECLEYHSSEIEKALWFSERVETTKNGKPFRTMGGILSTVDSGNIVDATSATTDMEWLEERLYEIFKYGSSEKMCFLGNRALLTVQQIVRKNSTFQILSGIKEYGMNVQRLICPMGELVMKSHPLFNQMFGGTTGTGSYYGVESWMWVLDMANVMYVNFNGADTKYQPDLQANGIDGMKSGYLTECSIEIHHPTTHYIIKGLHTPSVDT